MTGEQAPDAVAIDTWWNAVLAGGVDEQHPVHGDDLKVSISHGVLHLAGALSTEQDRQELLTKAQAYVGHGIDGVDAKRLMVVKLTDRPGILEQTLMAAYRNRDVAELARNFLVGIRRLNPKHIDILVPGQEDEARRLVPEDFMSDVQKAFQADEAILLLRVDETEAFRGRGMLAEDTRSRWTVTTPPTAAGKPGADG